MTLEKPPSTAPGYTKLAEHLRSQALDLNGPFELSSGQWSAFYLDAKLTGLDPEGISLSVDAITDETAGLEFKAIGGLELGAAPIIGAFVDRSFQAGRRIAGFIVRKEEKTHGTRKLIEGPLPQDPCSVVIVDDVVTTGKSIMQAVEAVRNEGHKVVLAISVVDREEGAARLLREAGIDYRPLVTASQLGIGNHVNPGSSPRSPSESL